MTAASTRYWFDAASRYFPYETGYGPNRPGNPYDAMFTPLATMAVVPGSVQGTDYADFSLIPAHVTGPDVALVQTAVTGLILNQSLTTGGATTTTSLPATLGTVRASWRSIEVPVVLITAQLLLLAWLLLFLIVADAAEARGPEVALAKMRGRGRWRTLTFGLAEPVILLAVALPLGVLAGWAITAGLGHILFRPGTPVGLPATCWLAAAVATAGGLAAVAATARRTLRRSVVGQWQRASRNAAQRGWVLDAILITAAVAGLVELAVSGQIGSARRGVLGLLLPGLLGDCRRGGRIPAADHRLPGRVRDYPPQRPDRPVPRPPARRAPARRDADHDRARHRVRPGRVRRRDLVGQRGQHQVGGRRPGRRGYGSLRRPARRP